MNIKPLPMRDVFLEKIWNEMSLDSLIFFVSADFGSPVLDKIREDFPDRFINVGIAEQNLINISAGLAIEGYKVFAYAIAPFITMRCFEQIRVSLALLSEVRPMNVSLIGVGAGYSYVVSGPTHQCYEDITIMRALPNFQVLSPADHITTASLFDSCIKTNGLRYLRLDAQVQPVLYPLKPPVTTDGFYLHEKGEDVCFIATGFMVHTAFKIAEKVRESGFKVGIIDIFDLTNFSNEKLKEVLESYSRVVSMEEGFSGRGGLDSMLFEFIAKNKLDLKALSVGVEPGYSFELGSREELHEKVGIGVQSALKKIQPFMRTIINEIKE
jgi:transketolase